VTRQAAETANALWTRLGGHFDDTPRTAHIETAAGQANWPHGFGRDIPDVRTVVVHCTAGWPNTSKWDEFVQRYTVPTSASRGIGPHFYMAYNGEVFRLLSENRECWHGMHVNGWAIGVETGNLMNVAAPTGAGGPWPNHWTALTAHAEDVPGAKLYARFVNNEILVALWSTSASPQVDSHSDGAHMMWISEAQYRSWALLARWLAEVWRVPRNFPLRPQLMRSDAWQAARWRTYREIVNADPMREPHIRTELQPAPYSCPPAVFDSDDPATGLPHVYAQGVTTTHWTTTKNGVTTHHQKQVNELWTRLFHSFRGFHAHGYSGANTHEDHNCPGAWFDWHRFARDVWDYWWYPFDLAQAPVTLLSPATTPVSLPAPPLSGRPRRNYGNQPHLVGPQEDLPPGYLHEHYFDEDPALFALVTPSGFFPVGEETVVPHPFGGATGPIGEMIRMWRRYWGFWHGGMHFHLDNGSLLYAVAAGQLVAARLAPLGAPGEDPFHREDSTSAYPSASFVLLRHEVFFQRRGGGDRIDYDQEPARVYSLYMHVGTQAGLSSTDIVDANPDWLNRAIAMKKEYDAGLAFHGAHANPAAQWTPHVTRWTRQQTAIDAALADLEAGRIAVFPQNDDAIHVSLGDKIGLAGHLDRNVFGLHFEVFSRAQLNDPWFDVVDQSASAGRPYHDEQNLDDVTTFLNARVPAPANGSSVSAYRVLPAVQKAARFQKVALRSKSEWALAASDFPAGGWAAAEKLMWWTTVVPVLNNSLAADAAAQLPADGIVWHYHPLGFLAWLNGVTWRSEWPKFRVTDAAGAAVPAPARPPPRRR
jgi:hypothetical protein